jgi:hypothetical protein
MQAVFRGMPDDGYSTVSSRLQSETEDIVLRSLPLVGLAQWLCSGAVSACRLTCAPGLAGASCAPAVWRRPAKRGRACKGA